MTKAGERLLEGAREAVAIAKGEQPAAQITIAGHHYVPEDRWQPIDTAPRDGTHVLILIGETIPDLPDVRVGQWLSAEDATAIGDYGPAWMIWNSGDDWFCVKAPLGWIPLPNSWTGCK